MSNGTATPSEAALQELAESAGYANYYEMVNCADDHAETAAICTRCGYTTDADMDTDRSECPSCSQMTLSSGLIIAGMI